MIRFGDRFDAAGQRWMGTRKSSTTEAPSALTPCVRRVYASSMFTIPATKLRSEIFSTLNDVRDGREYLITHHGHPVAVLVPFDVHQEAAIDRFKARQGSESDTSRAEG